MFSRAVKEHFMIMKKFWHKTKGKDELHANEILCIEYMTKRKASSISQRKIFWADRLRMLEL